MSGHRAPALLLLNPAARQGTAGARLARVLPHLAARFELDQAVIDSAGEWRMRVAQAIAVGVPLIIAAGGDGTVSSVAGAIVTCGGGHASALGAIALGSSNDYHKPASGGIAGVPCRLDLSAAISRDVGRVRYADEHGTWHSRLFLLSASLGWCAEGNCRFNNAGAPLRTLTRWWPGAAIMYAALRSLQRHRPQHLRIDDEPWIPVSNLSVTKTPHLAGRLRLNGAVTETCGQFAVNLCFGAARRRLLRVLMALAGAGKVSGRDVRSWSSSTLRVEAPSAIPLELDGEVVFARAASFEVVPGGLRTCV